MKKYLKRFARIRTRNFTAQPLRKAILTDHKAVVRLGSTTPTTRIFPNTTGIVEINTVDAIQNSRSKLRMKNCFEKEKIPQADWWCNLNGVNLIELPYPMVVKRVFGFQGHGMQLLNDYKELNSWIDQHPHWDIDGWFFEKFYNYAREYRLHVAKDIGVFLSWRKLRTKDAKERWFFNSINSNWVGEDHELFDRPKPWKLMEKAAIDCLKATGLDIGAVDIRVQSNDKDNPSFIVCEINSAPALGDYGIEQYKEVIKKLINNKANE